MQFTMAMLLMPGEVWLVVGVIAAWLVLMCLRSLGHELDYATRCHNLKVEVHTLRLQQIKRMRDMGVARGRHQA